MSSMSSYEFIDITEGGVTSSDRFCPDAAALGCPPKFMVRSTENSTGWWFWRVTRLSSIEAEPG